MTFNPRTAERSLMSFRPSVYSTGEQPVQPYTPIWPEYGESWWFKYTSPIAYLTSKAIESKEGSTGGVCTDHSGVLGTPGARVACDDLAAAGGKEKTLYDQFETATGTGDHDPGVLCDEECEKKKRRAAVAKVALASTLGLLTAVAVMRKVKYGKVL